MRFQLFIIPLEYQLKQTNMKVFKNTTAKFERTNNTQVLFAIADTKPEGNWIAQESDVFEIEMDYVYEVSHLYTQAGVKYYGWL